MVSFQFALPPPWLAATTPLSIVSELSVSHHHLSSQLDIRDAENLTKILRSDLRRASDTFINHPESIFTLVWHAFFYFRVIKRRLLLSLNTGWSLSLVPPNFSTKKKTAKQPITAFLSNRISWNSSSDWLLGGFIFGNEIGGCQWKKSPCINHTKK